ncbi:sugar ABC transporter substrate-binding protein [Streptococcus gordonii]|uniref:ABC transporter substrate-binding protein n=1 Tax=Streptococcus TaxID=1301 RepID=UPI0008B0CE28|nr:MULTISPECIES: sugar ABC transporter substrate-binding protein [Streptococcus]RKV73121.1 MAG: sugar ABC transporter substrate-binding protein [Streptococcus sp.]MBN2960760.1 sugar ABC transporter substrate-binding protein [Streptococcus gordonii]MBW7662957.1 sugar ABC transporter substrate-binding protein [Streptococcus gordonii]MBZ2134750.1 sugar ABC transporter substrate-binding protein [Streptococcus gordonii]MBZ2147477.1 sugar ABC transporter substrate-binding protein [Streptococcus gord
MRKGVILSMVAALSLGLLAGCSGGSSSKTSKEAASKDDVKVWVQFSDETAEGKAWEQVVQNFNKKYKGKYKVVTEYIPRSGSGGGYEDKVNAAITTNSLPDVITLDGPNTAAYAKSKVITPLDDYLKDNNMEDVLDSIKQQGTYDGKFYAFGYSESNVGIYYNKKMFKEAGIDESSLPTLKKPWTWDEFKAVSKKLKDHFKEAAIDFRLNSNDEMLPYAYMPLIWSNGGSVVNEDGTKAEGYFNSKESTQAVQFIQDLVKEGYTTVSPVEKGFETGQYPMVLSGSWTIADLQTNYKDIDFGILPYPVSNKTKKLVSPSGSWQLAVTTKSNKKDAAAEFVKFATNTESSEILSLGNSVLPIRKSTIENIKDKVSEPMRFLMEQNAATAHARPVVVAYPQVSRSFQQAMQDISYYEENPDVQKVLDSRAKEMQTAIDDSLKK